MDTDMEAYLKGKYRHSKVAKDKSLSRISHKIRDVLTPLTKIWQLVENARSGKNTNEKCIIEKTAMLMQQSVTLVGQAINAVNFYRRKSVLSALNGSDSTSATCIRETYVDESEPDFFGEQFMKGIKKSAKTQNSQADL